MPDQAAHRGNGSNRSLILWQAGRRDKPCARCGKTLLFLIVSTGLILGACRGSGKITPYRLEESSSVPSLPPGEVPSGAIAIVTRQAGMVRLYLDELGQAAFPVREVDPHQVRLTLRGETQALWVRGEEKDIHFIFYAAPVDSLYTQENVYRLEWGNGPGLAMEERTPPKDENRLVTTSTASLTQEENLHYAPQVEEGDGWLWQAIPALQEAKYIFSLAEVAEGVGRLGVEVWASTEAPANPDHHLRLVVNGQVILDEAWDSRGRRRLDAPLPAGLLVEGENTLQIQAVGDTDAPADIIFLDRFEVSYSRRLIAEEGRLAFESQGWAQELTGLRGAVAIYDITDPARVSRAGQMEGQNGALRFTGQPGHRYLAVGETGYQKPARLRPVVFTPDLRGAGSGADWIAIGAPDLLEPLQLLMEWRAGQGLMTLAVPVEAIFDQFGASLPEPEAIHSFLKFAAGAWQPAPRYVLLVGDATYDPRGYQTSPQANRLPALFLQTSNGGQTASDVLFTLLDSDDAPDLAIGRIPARTPDQVRVFVEKVLAYENDSAPGEWRQRILAVADGQDPAFGDDARYFLSLFPASYDQQIYTPAAGAMDAPGQIRERINEGAFLIAYFGHGSVNLWGKDRLFSVEDVMELKNSSRLPVMVHMTCLTGLFTHPKNESLAEALLWQPEGGAAAVIAPTSLTLPLDQGFLSEALARAFLQDPSARLGDLLLQAQRNFPPDSPGAREVMLTYLLFGDPGQRLVGE